MPDEPMLTAALRYASRGLPVMPCGMNKKPLVDGGFKAAVTDAGQIQEWWTRWPNALIGLPTGRTSDLLVLDVDVHSHDGFQALRSLAKSLELDLSGQPCVVTPSGGNHYYFRLGGLALKSTVSRLGPGLDTRGEGAYIIVPPSRPDPSRPGYAFVNGADILAAPVVPPDLAKLLKDGGKHDPQHELEMECGRVAKAPEGTRNDVLNRAAFKLAKFVKTGRLTETVVRARLTAAADDAGLTRGETESTLDSALGAGMAAARGPKGSTKDGGGRALTFPEIEPWPDPVDGAALLEDMVSDLRAYVVMSDDNSHATVLWALHCHVFEAFEITPRLNISSPQPDCGKTTLLDVLASVTPRAIEAANISAAAVFRTVEAVRPTLLIDEADTFIAASDGIARHRQQRTPEKRDRDPRRRRGHGTAPLLDMGAVCARRHRRLAGDPSRAVPSRSN